MTFRTIGRCSALGLGLAVLLVCASSAFASTTVINDSTGDASLCDTYAGTGSVCPVLGSDPTIDIQSVELGANAAADLVVEIGVQDLDDPMTSYTKEAVYSFTTWLNGGQSTFLALEAERHGDATVGYIATSGSSYVRAVTPVAFDFSSNTVRWELTLDRLNELFDQSCPACPDLAVGSALTPIQVAAYTYVQVTDWVSQRVVNQRDSAYTAATYEIGD